MNFFFATSIILAANVASAQLATRHRRHRRGLAGTNDAAFDQEAGMSMPSDLSMSMELSLDAIIGGTTLEEKPDYLVSMVKCGQGPEQICSGPHDCSGVLIASNVLLTSADCMIDVVGVGPDGLIFGRYGGWADFFREDITGQEKRGGVVRYFFDAEDVVLADEELVPRARGGPLDSIALVFLRYPAPPGTKIIKLSQSIGAPDGDDALNVVGWDTYGDEISGAPGAPPPPPLPSTLPVSYLSNDECIAEIERGGGLLVNPPNITDKQLCANAEPGQGTCITDKGSPLIRDGKYVEGIFSRPLSKLKDTPRTEINTFFYFGGWDITSIIPVLQGLTEEESIVLGQAVQNVARSVFSDEISRGLLDESAIQFTLGFPPFLFVGFVEPCVDGNCTLQEEESTLAKDAEESLESNFRALLSEEADACEANCIGLSSALGEYPGDEDVINDTPDTTFVPKPLKEDTCATEFPTIYTRISSYNSWIKKTICERTGEFCKKSSKASK